MREIPWESFLLAALLRHPELRKSHLWSYLARGEEGVPPPHPPGRAGTAQEAQCPACGLTKGVEYRERRLAHIARVHAPMRHLHPHLSAFNGRSPL